MVLKITWEGWDSLNIHGRTWLQKKADGLVFLKLVSRNGLGISHALSCTADTRESDIYSYMVECNRYYN